MKKLNKFFGGALLCAGLTAFCGGAAIAACSGDDIETDKVNGKKYGCNCNDYYDRTDYANGSGVKNNFRIFSTFPNLRYCYDGSNDYWKNAGTIICDGKNRDDFDTITMESVGVRTGNGIEAKCWSWKCKAGMAFPTDPITGEVSYSKCVPCDAALIKDGVCQLPCDTESTITITVNGQKKTVQANVRYNGKCMAVCQSGDSSVDTSDPTEYRIILK